MILKIISTMAILAIDWYIFRAFIVVFKKKLSPTFWNILRFIFWAIPVFIIVYTFCDMYTEGHFLGTQFRKFVIRFRFILYSSKLFACGFLFIEDAFFWVNKLLKYISKKPQLPLDNPSSESKMTRSEFLSKTALIAGTAPIAVSSYGIAYGAHDYQVNKETLYLPNLPKAFDGVTIAQISDIHSGSFFNRVAVQGGIDLLLAQKPDMVFFTGDLVNYEADEIKAYYDIFKHVKAPLGTYSVLGNHDYGEYKSWMDPKLKARNLDKMILAHQELGWDLLQDENRKIRVGSDHIAILGVGNWGVRGRSNRHGHIDKAYAGTEEAPVKLLLSHDPSHWRAQIIEGYKDIDATFSGHTHGMQVNFDFLGMNWSPIQMVYKEWAGLYQEDKQYLYVNRGYGYADIFPCRIGMPPEISIFELKKA